MHRGADLRRRAPAGGGCRCDQPREERVRLVRRGQQRLCPERRRSRHARTGWRHHELAWTGSGEPPMNIVGLVKQVPDTYSERKLSPSDGTLDRDATDAVLDEINERAVEAALQLKEAHGGEVTVVT